ncbi:MAG: hypothetical protein PW786_12345 [Arachidicoccus sp.]|nr:hypothetical protein [Arachidicoccus sp.]
MFKKKFISSLWLLLGIAAIGFLFIGAKEKGEKNCKGINIDVAENAKQVFVDEDGIKIEIQENGGKIGKPINAIDLRMIETQLKKDAWIKDAKLYFDNNQILQAELKENDPVARIFTLNGNSFYIDSAANYLPTNRNVLARVPVITGFPTDKQKLSSPDSLLLQQAKTLACFIINDSLWMAFTSQINITPDAKFQIVPVAGNAIITIGNVDDLQDKFNRLYSFYKQVLSKAGINKYQRINVEYAGQVVAANGNDSSYLNQHASDDSLLTNLIVDSAKHISPIIKTPQKAKTESTDTIKSVKHLLPHLLNKKKKINIHTTTKKPYKQ